MESNTLTTEKRERTQISFEADPELAKRLTRVVRKLKGQGIKRRHIGNVAISEKLSEIEDKLERGETVSITL